MKISKRSIFITGSAAAIGVIAIVGFAYSGIYDVSASSSHSNIVNWLLTTTSHASVERQYLQIYEETS